MAKKENNMILCVAFILIVFSSCTTVVSETISSEILCHDHSVRSADGALLAEISFEKPVISGLESEQAEEKINTFFETRYQNWLNGTGDELSHGYDGNMQNFTENFNDMREYYADEAMKKQPLKYTVDSTVVCAEDDFYSVKQDVLWFSGGPSDYLSYGTVFDTSSGERVPITELCDISPQEINNELENVLHTQGMNYEKIPDNMYNFWYDGESLYIPIYMVHYTVIAKLTDGEFGLYDQFIPSD